MRRSRLSHQSTKYEEVLLKCPEEVKEIIERIRRGTSRAKHSHPNQYIWTYTEDYKYFSDPVTFKWMCTPSWNLCALYGGFRWYSKKIEGCPPNQWIARRMISSFSAPYVQVCNKELIVAAALRQLQPFEQQDIITPHLFSENPILREAAKLVIGDK